MKISIIGGGGRVGSCAAFALQCSGIVKEIILLDANHAAAEGEALDLLHGAAFCADQNIRAGNYADCAQSDLICITAGLRRKPDESRLDLIARNATLFRDIIRQLKEAGLRKDAIIFVGTMLDTSRLCSLIASTLQLPATQVRAMVLGEHGDTMVPIWSAATLDGFPLLKFPGVTPTFQNQIFERTQKSGAEVISRKGGAGYAVGVAIREVIDCIALDRRRVLPVSSHIKGAYGIRDISISVPTVVGRAGVVQHVELELWPKEMQGLQASAKALKDTRAKVK